MVLSEFTQVTLLQSKEIKYFIEYYFCRVFFLIQESKLLEKYSFDEEKRDREET